MNEAGRNELMEEHIKFDDYQKETAKSAAYQKGVIPNHQLNDATYLALGLCGESGEVGNKIKKLIRDVGNVPDESANDLAEELGDALWYLARLSATLGFSLSTIAALNIEKIRRRKAERESRDENR